MHSRPEARLQSGYWCTLENQICTEFATHQFARHNLSIVMIGDKFTCLFGAHTGHCRPEVGEFFVVKPLDVLPTILEAEIQAEGSIAILTCNRLTNILLLKQNQL